MSAPATVPKSCTSCGAPIYWARRGGPVGAWHPIDKDPTPHGELLMIHSRRANLLIYMKLSDVPDVSVEGRNRYQSHFATCPNAKNHRKARR